MLGHSITIDTTFPGDANPKLAAGFDINIIETDTVFGHHTQSGQCIQYRSIRRFTPHEPSLRPLQGVKQLLARVHARFFGINDFLLGKSSFQATP